tara:strand:+ start:1056 stop:1766 length:711 start_codon:yes stop_codon:yes gene_type:complete
MAFSHSPKIVNDGLIFHVDAADKNCYGGTGATVNDLSPSGLTSTFSNPAYDSSVNQGSFDLDGINKKITVPSSAITNLQKNFSFEVWFNKRGVGSTGSAYDSIFQKEGGLSGFPVYGIRASSEANPTNLVMYFAFDGSGSHAQATIKSNGITIGEWVCCSVTVSSGRVAKGYYQGGLKTSTTLSADLKDENNTCKIGEGDNRFWNGYIPIVKIYNRELSADEVLQNYNATKSRFGL